MALNPTERKSMGVSPVTTRWGSTVMPFCYYCLKNQKNCFLTFLLNCLWNKKTRQLSVLTAVNIWMLNIIGTFPYKWYSCNEHTPDNFIAHKLKFVTVLELKRGSVLEHVQNVVMQDIVHVFYFILYMSTILCITKSHNSTG